MTPPMTCLYFYVIIPLRFYHCTYIPLLKEYLVNLNKKTERKREGLYIIPPVYRFEKVAIPQPMGELVVFAHAKPVIRILRYRYRDISCFALVAILKGLLKCVQHLQKQNLMMDWNVHLYF